MKYRVLHIIDHTVSGGAQVAILHILRTLKDLFSFGVAVLGSQGQYSDAYKALGIPVFAKGNPAGQWNPLPVTLLVDVIRREKFNLVHNHLLKANILGTIAGKWTGVKTIIHDHSGVFPETLNYHFSNGLMKCAYFHAYHYALSRCDRVLVLTPRDSQDYSEFYSVNPQQVTVLPNAVDPQEFSPVTKQRVGESLRQELGLSPESRLIVMVGRLDPKKDWLAFLQVAEQVEKLSNEVCGFLVVGSGKEDQNLRNYARSHKLKRVFFLGHRTDIPSLLAQTDIFLITSRRESFSIAVLEAMAAEIPVVATRSAGPQSILTHKVDGLLADLGDVEGLTHWVLQLLTDRELAQRLASNARKTVISRYGVAAFSARVADIYREVLEQEVL